MDVIPFISQGKEANNRYSIGLNVENILDYQREEANIRSLHK